MKNIIKGVLLVVLIVSMMYVADATPSAEAKEKPPFKYTNYQSYLTPDGEVKLRKYRYDYEINSKDKGHRNPHVGKRIKSIKKVGASDEQNYWIWQTMLQCGSIDAVYMVEAESGWVLDRIGFTGDRSLFQWSPNPKHNKRSFINHPDFWTWEFQVREGCNAFRTAANKNTITLNPKNGEWRSGEAHKWRAMPHIYSKNIIDQFYVEYYE